MAQSEKSLHQFRIDANKTWKDDTFSLSGLVKYVQGGTNKDLNELLSKTGLKPDVITVPFLLKHANPELLVYANDSSEVKNKDGKIVKKAGDVFKKGDKKTRFSLWFVTGTVLKFHAEIKAAAQSSKPKVIQAPKTELEAIEQEVKVTGARVKQNKRSNAAKKANAVKKAA